MEQADNNKPKTPILDGYIIFAVAATFCALKIILSLIGAGYMPELTFSMVDETHVHHFVYGIAILASAGYLALYFHGPRAKKWLALFYGFGLALIFDEIGMWLRLKEIDGDRLRYTGILAVIFIFVVIAIVKLIARIRRQKKQD